MDCSVMPGISKWILAGDEHIFDNNISLDTHTLSPEIHNVESDDDSDKLPELFYNYVSLDQWQELLKYSMRKLDYSHLDCRLMQYIIS